MKSNSQFSLLSPQALFRLYGAVTALWLVVITLKAVSPDEIEHAHVAWLIYGRGLAPFRDFFQHHMPLLWDVLGVHYLAGGEGPYVLYFGRALVFLCALATIAALHRIGRQITTGQEAQVFSSGMAGALFFLAPTTLIPTLFVARPETLGTALFFASYLFWLGSWKQDARHPLVSAVLAGTFFCLANLASPRFLLLSGIYLLAVDDRWKPIVFDWKRLSALAIAALAVGIGYLIATDITLADIAYILSFSALLQGVGDSAHSHSVLVYVVLFSIIGLLISIVLYRCTKHDLRPRLIMDLCYLAIVIILSFMAAGKFVYAADMSPVFVLGSLLMVRGYKRIELQYEPRDLFFGGSVALLVLLLVIGIKSNLFLPTEPLQEGKPINLLSHVKLIEQNLVHLPENGKVLLGTGEHLIAAEDASYYWSPLQDNREDPNRLCRAVDAAQATWPLPGCDYLEALKAERPFFLTKRLWSLGAGEELEEIESLVDRHYIECERYYVRKRQPGARCPDKT